MEGVAFKLGLGGQVGGGEEREATTLGKAAWLELREEWDRPSCVQCLPNTAVAAGGAQQCDSWKSLEVPSALC